ncbi:glycosyltransferase family 4 protein [Rhodoflexus caldus]|uniref:glycosyltransferase family 4 protein n=1 Tax=Rhodoflexus caldus TaxID=2891236 RepID=UPI002029DA7B|nr:glycosyltransferase family 4 protein [Rhodoflexus caldus]
MRVLLITPSFPPDRGACPRHMQGVVDGLVQAGHEVVVLTALPHYPQGKIDNHFRGKLFHQDFFKGYEVWRCALMPSASVSILPRLFSVLSLMFFMLLRSKTVAAFAPEWIIVQSPPLPLALLGWWFARQNQARLILNISDLWPDVLAQMGVISRSNLLFRWAKQTELLLYEKADIIIAQSEESVAYIQRYVPEKQVLLYRVGILPEKYTTKKPRMHQPRRLIYFGLIGMAQGLEDICQTIPFARLGVELHIFGDGPLRNRLQNSLAGTPNEAFCQLHESVDYTAIPTLLADFDGALIPQQQRLYGTVPSKLYEAMAAGLPVIFSGEGEAAEIVQRASCGWTASAGNWQQLRQCIYEFAAADDEQLHALGSAGRLFAVQHFHLDAQNKLLADVLQPTNCLTV